MDLTVQYLKMCEKAVKDIGWTPRTGDYAGDSTLNKVIIVSGNQPVSKELIPLYRQDQLQEIISPKYDYYALVCSLYEWTRQGPAPEDWATDYSEKFMSMEQLWLAFVMSEKYNKVWDGADWILDK